MTKKISVQLQDVIAKMTTKEQSALLKQIKTQILTDMSKPKVPKGYNPNCFELTYKHIDIAKKIMSIILADHQYELWLHYIQVLPAAFGCNDHDQILLINPCDLLQVSYDWEDTEEGWDYWSEVYDNMAAFIDTPANITVRNVFDTYPVTVQTYIMKMTKILLTDIEYKHFWENFNNDNSMAVASFTLTNFLEFFANAFDWSVTPQGQDYWEEVYNRLESLVS